MANRIKGITVEIGGDTTKLSKALEGYSMPSVQQVRMVVLHWKVKS